MSVYCATGHKSSCDSDDVLGVSAHVWSATFSISFDFDFVSCAVPFGGVSCVQTQIHLSSPGCEWQRSGRIV